MQVHGVPGLLGDFAEKAVTGGGVPLFQVTPFPSVNSKIAAEDVLPLITQRIWSFCHVTVCGAGR